MVYILGVSQKTGSPFPKHFDIQYMSRVFTVNFKVFFCEADFQGQLQIFFPNGGRSRTSTPWRRLLTDAHVT
jgi:hypothetical protein